MAPKEKQRKGSTNNKSASINDPINTDDWRCLVVLTVENSVREVDLTRKFAQEAALGARQEVKSIDFDDHVIKIVKQFIAGDVDHAYNFLFNFESLFEEAAEYLKNGEIIPIPLLAKIIRAFILMLKKEEKERREKLLECEQDPIEIMASKPANAGLESENTKTIGKKTSDARESIVATKMKLRDVQGGIVKEDTKLLTRWEGVKATDFIDDAPDNSYFQVYIALTGFRFPELPLEMIKSDIPLDAVFCVNASKLPRQQHFPLSDSNVDAADIDNFWENLLRLIWHPTVFRHFEDVVFRMYAPEEVPKGNDELKKFMYNEISYLMYDISDLKLQHKNYLQHMRLLNVDEAKEKVVIPPEYVIDLNSLPYECQTVPLLMQFMLDVLCGEDGGLEESAYYGEYGPDVGTIFSYERCCEKGHTEARSGVSMIPLVSGTKVLMPRLSSVAYTGEMQILFRKIRELNILYDIEEYGNSSAIEGTEQENNPCISKRGRLPCENLDTELQTMSSYLSKIWMNHTNETVSPLPNTKLSGDLHCPELWLNYFLYADWVSKLDCLQQATESPSETKPLEDDPQTSALSRLTVTDCSRIILQKSSRSLANKDFFSPSELKIVDSSTVTSASGTKINLESLPAENPINTDYQHLVNLLTGSPTEARSNLRNLMEETMLQDYSYVEELSKGDLIRRLEESRKLYDGTYHAYSPVTDSVYIVFYNTSDDVKRQAYNVNLKTPVGLRDFFDYVLDDEQDWLKNQEQTMTRRSVVQQGIRTNPLYHPTPVIRDFPEHEFWHENSIKYSLHADSIQAISQGQMDDGSKTLLNTSDEKSTKMKKRRKEMSQSVVALRKEEPPPDKFDFFGFQLGPGAVQYSGLDTTYKGAGDCRVRAYLRERLYGDQELGVHVYQGGHTLHLYSYVCPRPHLEDPYTCHVEHKSGIIIAFSRRPCPRTAIGPEYALAEGDLSPPLMEDDHFAYDLKLSLPNGLTVQTIASHVAPCHIKQSYILKGKGTPQLAKVERNRICLPTGTIIKIMEDKTVEVLNADTSIITTSLDHLVTRELPNEKESSDGSIGECGWEFHTYVKTFPNGCQYHVVDGNLKSTKRFQIFQNADIETQTTYYKRMDATNCFVRRDGSSCTEFPDGSKIAVCLYEEDACGVGNDFSWEGGEMEGPYVVTQRRLVMEHPLYATCVYDERLNSWRILLPMKSEIVIDPGGMYHVVLDERTEVNINADQIIMSKYGVNRGLEMRTTADLTVFQEDPPANVRYCTTVDSTGKKFIVDGNANCSLTENDDKSSESHLMESAGKNVSPNKHFVVRGDWSGFEILHKDAFLKEVNEAADEGVVIHCEKLEGESPSRYFTLIRESMDPTRDKWAVESIVPDARYKSILKPVESRSTYGIPPSWLHPFPKKKRKIVIPQTLSGRIMLELVPCTSPQVPCSGQDYHFCERADLPEVKACLTEDVEGIMRRVADNDQDTLRDLYVTALKSRMTSDNAIKNNPQLQEYYQKSREHLELRDSLKKAIRFKLVPKYFVTAPGIAWLILRDLLEELVEDATAAESVTSTSKLSEETSEMEYDLVWPSEPSLSDLSYRSNLSMATAHVDCSKCLLPSNLPTPRDTRSEPIYKIKEMTPRSSENNSPLVTPTASHICNFTMDDLLRLQKANPPREREPKHPTYELEDLINLGLV